MKFDTEAPERSPTDWRLCTYTSMSCTSSSLYFAIHVFPVSRLAIPAAWLLVCLGAKPQGNIFFLQFQTKAKIGNNTQTLHINKTTATVKSIKFLGLTIDAILNWKHHISDLKPTLNKACYAIRSIKPFTSLAVLKSTYYSYAHFIMSYGLIFWGKLNW